MKKFKLNPEFAKRYAFVALLFLGMSAWFGYDGIVTYPKTPAAALYESIEKPASPPEMPPEKLEAFKAQKIKSQLGLMAILFFASAWVAMILFKAWKFDFDPAEAGEVKEIDRSRWEKKGIIVIRTEKAGRVTLDSWHHLGVKEYVATLPEDKNASA